MHEEDRAKLKRNGNNWLENDADILLHRSYRLRIVRDSSPRRTPGNIAGSMTTSTKLHL